MEKLSKQSYLDVFHMPGCYLSVSLSLFISLCLSLSDYEKYVTMKRKMCVGGAAFSYSKDNIKMIAFLLRYMSV